MFTGLTVNTITLGENDVIPILTGGNGSEDMFWLTSSSPGQGMMYIALVMCQRKPCAPLHILYTYYIHIHTLANMFTSILECILFKTGIM